MNRLVIGCGYLGLRVASHWKALGDEVAVLTRSQERAEALSTQGFKPVVGDVMSPASLAQLPDSDTILYAVGFDRSGGHSKRNVYVEGLRNVLTQIRGRCGRLIYVSSTSVYGQSSGESVDETSATDPVEENGRICVDAESALRQSFGPPINNRAIVLRLAGIYGPGRLLARIDQLKQGEPLTGNPAAWLNLIHVDDAVLAVIAADERGTLGETYLVCDDRPLRRIEYYSALAERVGAAPPRFAELAPDSSERRQLNKRCMNHRLRGELGVELRYPTIIAGLDDRPEALRGTGPLRSE